MTSRFKAVNPVRSEAQAIVILDAMLDEIDDVRPGQRRNGNWFNGLNRRYCNRLMSEAGYDYGEARGAVHAPAMALLTAKRRVA